MSTPNSSDREKKRQFAVIKETGEIIGERQMLNPKDFTPTTPSSGERQRPPFKCQKYKQSNPDAECDCKECVDGERAIAELKSTTNGEGDWENDVDLLREEFENLFPKDQEAIDGIRPSKSNRSAALVLCAKWNGIVTKAVTQAREEEKKRIVEQIQNHKFQMDIKDYLPKVKAWEGGYDRPFDDGYEQARKDFIATLTASLQSKDKNK